ncbi:Uncharacterised protein r2_g2555 [Pycnogonum litorale]
MDDARGRRNVTSTSRSNVVVETTTTFVRQPIRRIVEFDSLSSEMQQKAREDYYKSYDVNDGIRTAAALGGFISLFILFIIYKTKCKSKLRYHRNVTETPLIVDECGSKDGRTSQDVSNVFSNSSSTKGSNIILVHSDDFQSPTSQNVKSRNWSQSSCEGGGGGAVINVSAMPIIVSYNEHHQTTSCDCSVGGASGFSSAAHRDSPTDVHHSCRTKAENRRNKRRHRRHHHHHHQRTRNDSDSINRQDNLLPETSINIQVIQPTPNITPRGSLRFDDSYDNGGGDDDDDNPDRRTEMRRIIPLLGPLAAAATSGHRLSICRPKGSRSDSDSSNFSDLCVGGAADDNRSISSDSVFYNVEDEGCEMSSMSRKQTPIGAETGRKKRGRFMEETCC